VPTSTKKKKHQAALWEGLRTKALQVVAADHCPVMYGEKLARARENFAVIPNGGPGIKSRMQLLHHYGVNQGRINLNRWVDLASTQPAKIFGPYPRKGAIRVGSDADIVVWDPDQMHTISAASHHMRVDYSMFVGFRVKGNADVVLSRGEILVEKGEWLGRAGRGRYLKRSARVAGQELP
jgi:dihydropyrimidinase